MSDDTIYLFLDDGQGDGDSLAISVSPEVAEDLREGLQVEGVYEGDALAHSILSGPELTLLTASFGSGLVALTAALTAFLRRHDGKRIVLRQGDDPTIDVTGYGEEEARRVIEDLLRSQLRDSREHLDESQ